MDSKEYSENSTPDVQSQNRTHEMSKNHRVRKNLKLQNSTTSEAWTFSLFFKLETQKPNPNQKRGWNFYLEIFILCSAEPQGIPDASQEIRAEEEAKQGKGLSGSLQPEWIHFYILLEGKVQQVKNKIAQGQQVCGD